ncbi:CPBP family intramembrane glutamic endopeptidase [Sphingobacterium spiritivorum]|uniref:CAAX amino terminal protease family protein n=1 Tax=Sphingobacterium spiritivorum ATCC 33861 TaxID=525373 RepID=D7VRF3_SPHSI|nr:CPBP family intramembrane glutamic endopeptidase [Sphingobacterium spiritivorum]EFK56354.1 CAAX amino terminal protease family protein [Sphingobacterium spiritivorum ATCC 33861]QQT35563.1 CPBP family intramembrane metalloprotease [Sphingobacterium spiritivorum]WQD32261.1 CPBP family intramembrane glutamic endopeptidase [Sphingobacterium spiritivorum]SUJ07153.1 CAAX amino terminal protease self- immunity [Sphingobacterium spiritivorum]
MKNKVNYLAVLTFYIIAVALRYLTNKTDLLEDVPGSFIKVLLQASGPAIGALVVFYVFKIKPVLTLKGNYKSILIPFLLYWALPIVLILGVEYFIKGTVSFAAISAILIYGLLEEIGWRGFLQRELKPLPEFLNILLVATLWFIWHLNFDLTSSNLLFFGILVLGSWGIGKVADNTFSLLAVSAIHSLNNFFPEMNTTKICILLILLSVWGTALVIRKRNVKNKGSEESVIA